MYRYRLRALTRYLILFALATNPLLSSQPTDLSKGLHVILFEGDPSGDDVDPSLTVLLPDLAEEQTLDKKRSTDFVSLQLPGDGFPLQFSRLATPGQLENTEIRLTGVQIPRHVIFLDIHTVPAADKALTGPGTHKHKNRVIDLEYKFKVLDYSPQGFQLVLEGRFRKFRFGPISVQGEAGSTTLISMRKTTNRRLYVALTPNPSTGATGARPTSTLATEGLVPPQPIDSPTPDFPEMLLNRGQTGRFVFSTVIEPSCRSSPDQTLLLECTHLAFAQSALGTIHRRWTFRPGTLNGQSVSVRGTVEVTFRIGGRR